MLHSTSFSSFPSHICMYVHTHAHTHTVPYTDTRKEQYAERTMNADNGIWSSSCWFCYCMVHILFIHCVDNFSSLYTDLVYHFGNNNLLEFFAHAPRACWDFTKVKSMMTTKNKNNLLPVLKLLGSLLQYLTSLSDN